MEIITSPSAGLKNLGDKLVLAQTKIPNQPRLLPRVLSLELTEYRKILDDLVDKCLVNEREIVIGCAA